MGKFTDTSRKIIDAINSHDIDAIANLYASDAVAYDPMYPQPLRGRDAIRKDYAVYLRGFPDLRFELLTREPEDQCLAFGRVGDEIVLADDDLAFEEATCSDNESGHALSGRVDQRSADVPRVMPGGGLHPGVEIDAHALLRPLGALPPTPGSYLSTTCSNFPRGS